MFGNQQPAQHIKSVPVRRQRQRVVLPAFLLSIAIKLNNNKLSAFIDPLDLQLALDALDTDDLVLVDPVSFVSSFNGWESAGEVVIVVEDSETVQDEGKGFFLCEGGKMWGVCGEEGVEAGGWGCVGDV